MKKSLAAGLLMAASHASADAMTMCHGLLEFMDKKLEQVEDVYSKYDVDRIREGFDDYREYLLENVSKPVIEQFSAGDATKKAETNQQFNEFKANAAAEYKKRYKAKRIYMDYVLVIDECAKQAMPKGKLLEKLKYSLEKSAKMAMENVGS